jgi:hypothetical protein
VSYYNEQFKAETNARNNYQNNLIQSNGNWKGTLNLHIKGFTNQLLPSIRKIMEYDKQFSDQYINEQKVAHHSSFKKNMDF